MRLRLIIGACLAFLFASAVRAQHTVNLAWTVSTDDTTANCTVAGSCSQTVYRAPGACSTTSSYISLANLTATQATFADTNVPGGVYCYLVTFTLSGTESPRTDTVTVSLQPKAPTGIKVTGTT